MQAVLDAELRLLDPAVRASADLLAELLDPEFTEIGASGKYWDRASMISALTHGVASGSYVVPRVTALAGAFVAPGIAHVTFTTDDGQRSVRRASLWRFTEGRWRLYFHQGTPTTEPVHPAL